MQTPFGLFKRWHIIRHIQNVHGNCQQLILKAPVLWTSPLFDSPYLNLWTQWIVWRGTYLNLNTEKREIMSYLQRKMNNNACTNRLRWFRLNDSGGLSASPKVLWWVGVGLAWPRLLQIQPNRPDKSIATPTNCIWRHSCWSLAQVRNGACSTVRLSLAHNAFKYQIQKDIMSRTRLHIGLIPTYSQAQIHIVMSPKLSPCCRPLKSRPGLECIYI